MIGGGGVVGRVGGGGGGVVIPCIVCKVIKYSGKF